MPRQPYLPAFAHLQYSVGALVAKERPALLSLVGTCIAIWNQADNEMGCLFAHLLDTQSDAALEVFLTLRRASNQKEALRSAAKFRLNDDEKQIFDALLKLYGSLEAERNALAHGCFGICPTDQSLLFWIDTKEHVHFQTEVLAFEARGEWPQDPHKRLKENMYVYRKGDLDSLYGKMEKFWWAIFEFNGYMRRSAEPAAREVLERLRASELLKAEMG